MFQILLTAPCYIVWHHQKSLILPFLTCSLHILTDINDFPFHSYLPKRLPSLFTWGRFSTPITIFADLQWTLSSSILSILNRGANAAHTTPDVAFLGWRRGAASTPSTYWPWLIPSRGNSATTWLCPYSPPLFGLTIQPAINSARSVPFQAMGSLLFWENLWKMMSKVLQSSRYTGTCTNIHITACMCWYISTLSQTLS